MLTSSKPVPVPTVENQPYWDAARDHRLALPRCDRCGWLSQQMPIVCSKCRGEAFSWTDLLGRGRIFSYTVARQTTTVGFENEVPYTVVLVSIAEQPELVITTNLVGDFDVDELDIDLPVVITFEDRGDVVVPQFRLERA